MDIYFHASPKKKMLGLPSLKKKKSSAVGPQQQQIVNKDKTAAISASTITDFLQRTVNSTHAKKLWHQIANTPQKCKAHLQQKHQSPTILFDSNEHLATTAPPTPPPKKSQTMPNLSIITDNEHLMNRALPSLPSMESAISVGKRKNGITRATTWMGKSVQKWLTLPGTDTDKANMMSCHSELDEEELMYSSSLLPNVASQKLTLHCRSKFYLSRTIKILTFLSGFL
jgi:hypothetical protein